MLNANQFSILDGMFISGSHSLTKTLDFRLRARVSSDWARPPSQHCDAPHQGRPVATHREHGGDMQQI